MRAIFGVLGLLVVVAIVGVLAKKQLSAGVAPPATTAVPGAPTPASAATPQQQVQQYEQVFKGAIQQERPMPDDVK
jgi:hypothetical protein